MKCKGIKHKRKKNQNKSKHKYLIIIIVCILMFYIGRYIKSGEYKFIGHETSILNAKITRTNNCKLKNCDLKQIAYYNYTYKGKIYSHIVEIQNKRNYKKVGDILKVKISRSLPLRHIIIKFIN